MSEFSVGDLLFWRSTIKGGDFHYALITVVNDETIEYLITTCWVEEAQTVSGLRSGRTCAEIEVSMQNRSIIIVNDWMDSGRFVKYGVINVP